MLAFLFTPDTQNIRLKLSLIYSSLFIVLCSLYIYFSDKMAHILASNYQEFYMIQTVKGIAFIIISGAALFGLLYTGMGRFLKAKEIIQFQKSTVMIAEHRTVMGLLASATLHDINNFLMIVHMHLEVINADCNLDEPGRKSLAKVHSGLNNMLESTRCLLSFTKEYSKSPEPGSTAVKLIVSQAWNLLSHFRKDKKILFKCHEERRDIHALVSPQHLKQALINILLNSIQAIDAEGTVEVIIRSCPNETLIEVHDSGPGVLPERRSEIFRHDFTTKAYGTGLGLLSSRFCVELYGGRIEVGSSHLKGACFRIRLATS